MGINNLLLQPFFRNGRVQAFLYLSLDLLSECHVCLVWYLLGEQAGLFHWTTTEADVVVAAAGTKGLRGAIERLLWLLPLVSGWLSPLPVCWSCPTIYAGLLISGVFLVIVRCISLMFYLLLYFEIRLLFINLLLIGIHYLRWCSICGAICWWPRFLCRRCGIELVAIVALIEVLIELGSSTHF